MWTNPLKTAHLVTFTEEILNWKLHFLCSDITNCGLYRYDGLVLLRNLNGQQM